MSSKIVVRKARQHNLKNIDFEIPKDQFTVITGPSGSGKSTIAMDILYAEGQRRYMESLPSYARQFLQIPAKPDVEEIIGLCPSIAIDQKTISSSLRSTVGTVTEIYEFLRVLYSIIGIYQCTKCGSSVSSAHPSQIVQQLTEKYQKLMLDILIPIAQEDKGTFFTEIHDFVKNGYKRFIINGQFCLLKNESDILALKLNKTSKHTIYVIYERLSAISEHSGLLQDAIAEVFKKTKGLCGVRVHNSDGSFIDQMFAQELICVVCGTAMQRLDARYFSFNLPLGACVSCRGLGTPFSVLQLQSENNEEFFSTNPFCTSCNGTRLNKNVRSVFIREKNIFECASQTIEELLPFLYEVEKDLSLEQKKITERVFVEIFARLNFLIDVGLSYLTLMRVSTTLSGGEAQRIRLATQIGSGLSGILYVLDEPSIGLHQRDNDKLLSTLRRLKDLGNTLVVIEHDADTMLAADYIIDVGPQAGKLGGQIVAVGTPAEIIKNPASLTGQFLSGRKSIARNRLPRKSSMFLTLENASCHNLKHASVKIPLGLMCAVSGVSGSGKSSLIMGELVPMLRFSLDYKRHKDAVVCMPSRDTRLSGHQSIQDIVVVDQKPIGRTPRSNPATYLGIFDLIRALYASLPDARARGYTAGAFSFNTSKGHCPKCSGRGVNSYEMYLLPTVSVECPTCKGTGYAPAILEIFYKGKTIADILKMTAENAYEFFAHHTNISKKLQLMLDVGLGYIELGQSSSTLSGGEAQRIKLADELSKRGNKTMYILDEPTTGLHFQDIQKLLTIFDRLVDKGNSIIIIEHNIDVLAYADYIVDVGPEAGKYGGLIVAHGTPEEVALIQESRTGVYLKKIFYRDQN